MAQVDRRNNSIRRKAFCALWAALLCLLSPWSIPVGPIPISLCSFIILLCVFTLDIKSVLLSFSLYLLLGFVGLPVFSGFQSGIAVLVGPTGGYLIGYLPFILLSAKGVKHNSLYSAVIGIVSGTLSLYVFGVLHLVFLYKLSLSAALVQGALPFLPGDALKTFLAILLGPKLKHALTKENC